MGTNQTDITQTRNMSEQAQQQAMPEQATQIEATAPPAEDVFKGDNWSRQINMKKFPERAQFTIELTKDQIIVKGTTTSERTEYDMKVTTTEQWSKAFKRPTKVIAETVRCTTEGHFLHLTGSKVNNKKVVPVVIQSTAQPQDNGVVVVIEPLQRETTDGDDTHKE